MSFNANRYLGRQPYRPRSIAREYKLEFNDWIKIRKLIDKVLFARQTGKLLEKVEGELNSAWKEIAERHGFVWHSVRPAPNRSSQYVIAVPKEIIRKL